MHASIQFSSLKLSTTDAVIAKSLVIANKFEAFEDCTSTMCAAHACSKVQPLNGF